MTPYLTVILLVAATALGAPLVESFVAGGDLSGWRLHVWLWVSCVAFMVAQPWMYGRRSEIIGLCRYFSGWSALAAAIFLSAALAGNSRDVLALLLAYGAYVFGLRRLMSWRWTSVFLAAALGYNLFFSFGGFTEATMSAIGLALFLLPLVFALATCLLIAVSVHEASHAIAAHVCGDSTAVEEGRATIVPAHHFTLAGMIVAPVAMLALGAPIIFGWARPVLVDFRKLRDPRLGSALVAAAGPAANLTLSLITALVLALIAPAEGTYLEALGWSFVAANAFLGLINLFPFPPLDGGRIALALLSGTRERFDRWSAHEPAFVLLAILLLIALPWLLNGVLGTSWDPFEPLIDFIIWFVDLLTGGRYDLPIEWFKDNLPIWLDRGEDLLNRP